MPHQTPEPLHPESMVVAVGRPDRPGDPLNTPIIPVTAYRSSGADNDYARDVVSPTVVAFEQVLGALEGGQALAFSSGLAVLATVLSTLPAGAVVAVADEGYSGTVSTFGQAEEQGRLRVRRVDPGDAAAVAAACDGAALAWFETVSNPLQTVVDIPAAAAAVHAGGGLLAIDSTFSTPLTVQPLALGADIVMHSATKYLAGHSDVLLGALVVGDEVLHARLHAARTLHGGVPGVLEAYLATRGVRTLALRWERASATALTIARRLATDRRVSRVRYPALPDDPGHAVAARDHRGPGAVVCFELVAGGAAAEALCSGTRLITHATSLGGVETTIERRARYSVDASTGVPESLVRLSVGIEHVEDLWADLDQALGSVD